MRLKKIAIAGVLIVVLVVGFLAWYYKSNYVSFRLRTNAMAPTLQRGEVRLFKKVPIAEISRGDLVLIELEHAGTLIRGVSRVIGFPRERIMLQKNRILVDGKPIGLRELFPAVDRENGLSPKLAKYPAVDLQEDEVYIISDNFDRALDSRLVGPVAKTNIVGELLPWGDEEELMTDFFE